MTDSIKAELTKIRAQKDLAIATVNACIGAEQALNKLLSEIKTEGETTNAPTDRNQPELPTAAN